MPCGIFRSGIPCGIFVIKEISEESFVGSVIEWLRTELSEKNRKKSKNVVNIIEIQNIICYTKKGIMLRKIKKQGRRMP